jgi:tetratricopeptide (TPR) repeat protein
MKQLWPDTFVEEANLNVHVSAIRKAIGESAHNPRYISTIPGRGYRFAANLRPTDLPAAPATARTAEHLPDPRQHPRRLALAFAGAAAVLSGLVPLLYFRCAPHDRRSIDGAGAPIALASSSGSRKPVGRQTSAAAHQYYVMGRHHWNQRSTEGLRKAIVLFQKAIDEEPQYALAFVGLADAYSMLGDHTGQTSGEYRQQALAATMKALEIDDRLAEAHATLGYLRMRNWEWDGVEEELERAIEIDPGYATAHQWHSIFLELTGRPGEAVAAASRAQKLDPLSPIINESLGSRLFFARRYDDALKQLQKTIEIQPSFASAHESLAMVYIEMGRYEDALGEIARATREDEAMMTQAYAYARSGRKEKARAVLAGLRGGDPVELARVQSALGERDHALTLLERALAQHADHLAFLRVDPSWDSLRADARFTAIMKRVAL